MLWAYELSSARVWKCWKASVSVSFLSAAAIIVAGLSHAASLRGRATEDQTCDCRDIANEGVRSRRLDEPNPPYIDVGCNSWGRRQTRPTGHARQSTCATRLYGQNKTTIADPQSDFSFFPVIKIWRPATLRCCKRSTVVKSKWCESSCSPERTLLRPRSRQIPQSSAYSTRSNRTEPSRQNRYQAKETVKLRNSTLPCTRPITRFPEKDTLDRDTSTSFRLSKSPR